METNERDNMMADLYVLDEYYEKKASYDAYLVKANASLRALSDSPKVKMTIAGYDVFVSDSRDIKETFVKYGDRFDDNFLKMEKPNGYSSDGPLSLEPIPNLKRKCIPLVIGTILLIFGTGFLIPHILGASVLLPIAAAFYLLGAPIFLYGLYAFLVEGVIKKRKAMRINKYRMYLAEEKRIWEETYVKRLSLVEEVYKEEYEESVRLYNSEVEKAKEKYLARSNEIKDKTKAIESIKENALALIQNSVIPSYYLQNPQAVRKMLFLVLNKRADTVKELVNTYETEKWQEQVLAQLGVYCKAMAVQSQQQIETLIAINERLTALHYDITHLEFTSFGVAF